MNAAKLRLLADYIEKNRRNFDMCNPDRCIVGFGLRMDGNIGFYDADQKMGGGVAEFARRFDMPKEQARQLFEGMLHGKRNRGHGGSADLLRSLADEADPPVKTIPIVVKSEPVAITVAIRTTVKERELVPA